MYRVDKRLRLIVQNTVDIEIVKELRGTGQIKVGGGSRKVLYVPLQLPAPRQCELVLKMLYACREQGTELR